MIPEHCPDGFKQVWFVAPLITRDLVQETAARLCIAERPSLQWRDVYCHTRGLHSWLRSGYGTKAFRVFVPPKHEKLIQDIGMELVRKQFGNGPKERRKSLR